MKLNNNLFKSYKISKSKPKIIIYIANGIMIDPVESIKEHNFPENSNVYLIYYHLAPSLKTLVHEWLKHIENITQESTKIILVGFSAGALVIHRMVSILSELNIEVNIRTISISPAHLKNFNMLKEFTVDFLENLPDKIGKRMLKRLPWSGNYPLLSYDEIIEQLKLFRSDKIYENTLGVVDIIVIPYNDKLCCDVNFAKRHANDIGQINGKHDIQTLPLVSIINNQLTTGEN